VIADEDVWIASTDGRLIRLSLNGGEEKWIYEIRGSFLAAPSIVGERLFIGDDDGVMRCFGPSKSSSGSTSVE
jgi:outer membrane protein assembly factor BamB